MDSATLSRGQEFKGSNLYASPPEELTLQHAANNTALMDMIYGILDRGEGLTSPTYPTHVKHDLSKAKVLQWASSLSEYQSPVDRDPPLTFPDSDHSLPRSPSPMGSMTSDSSSHDSSSGPKTPTTSKHVPAPQKRFSWEKADKVPETSTNNFSGPSLSVPPGSSSHYCTNSSPSPSPVPAMKATITSLVDDFMPGFVPEFESPTVKAKPANPPILRISTEVPPYPVTPTSRRPELIYPAPIRPSPQVVNVVSPQSSTRSSSSLRRSAEVRGQPLKDLGNNFSPIRQSMGTPATVNRSVANQERPYAQARHSVPSPPNRHVRADDHLRVGPRPPALSVVIEERPQIPTSSASVYSSSASKSYEGRDRFRRKSSMTPSPTVDLLMTPEYLRNQARYSMMPLPSKALQVEQQHLPSPTRPPPSIPRLVEQQLPSPTRLPPSIPQLTPHIRHSSVPLPSKLEQEGPAPIRHSLPAPARRTQKDIEAVPERALATPKDPVNFGTDLGAGDTKGLFAGEQGLQFTMSRRVVTMSKMEWAIESPCGSKVLKCYEQTNSLSRKRDFFDVDGNRLFDFQRRTGSTRTAESPMGVTLFVVKNVLLHLTPHWAVSMGHVYDHAAPQWVAKGDEALKNVIVTWGGFQVGRISCESGLKKHTYTVSIAPEINYAIMAALTTVFDDLRTDEGC